MDKIRINKYLSEIGYCSRRQCDELVVEGRVVVNGEVAAPGMKVSDEDEILIDGKAIGVKVQDVALKVLAFNKPKGVVCSTEGQGAVTVDEYLKLPYRVFYVGRLDKDSEGLLLLTNDGELANDISKARNNHEKEYVVNIDRPVTDSLLDRLRGGITLEEGKTRPCKAWKTGEKSFHIVLTQGLNRQIRRMCGVCGVKVVRLRRIRVMNVKLGDLESGKVRELTESELEELRKGVKNE